MEKELNYLSSKIEILEGKIYTLETNKKHYTTPMGINFYDSQLIGMEQEKEVLENILNALTINELT